MDAPLAGILAADLAENVAGRYCTRARGLVDEVVPADLPGRAGEVAHARGTIT